MKDAQEGPQASLEAMKEYADAVDDAMVKFDEDNERVVAEAEEEFKKFVAHKEDTEKEKEKAKATEKAKQKELEEAKAKATEGGRQKEQSQDKRKTPSASAKGDENDDKKRQKTSGKAPAEGRV